MGRKRVRPIRLGPAAAVAALVAVASPVSAILFGVSLKVSTERVSPGAMGQMKVFITEPKPISTGSGTLTFPAYDAIDGIALASPADDTYGVAVVRGTEMKLAFVSPSGTFGTATDYPVLAVAGRLHADTPLGSKIPFTLDPAAMQFLDPTGVAYPLEIKNGHMVAEPGVSIHDVVPGSADLPAGGVVTVLGSGFEPDTDIQFKETVIAQQVFVDSGRIDVVLGGPVHMHGVMVRATNPDGSRCKYYSYQRTRPDGYSSHPILHDVVPVFPSTTRTIAAVDVTSATAGLALQNIGPGASPVIVQLVSGGQDVLATRALTLASSRFMVRELSEIFGMTPADGDTIRVESQLPIQVMGIAIQPDGTARPQLAR